VHKGTGGERPEGPGWGGRSAGGDELIGAGRDIRFFGLARRGGGGEV